MVEVDAFAFAVVDLQVFANAVFVNGEGQTGIDAAQHTDESGADVVACGDLWLLLR
jgi:glutamate dehydrogenase/leucine dehydrogenase